MWYFSHFYNIDSILLLQLKFHITTWYVCMLKYWENMLYHKKYHIITLNFYCSNNKPVTLKCNTDLLLFLWWSSNTLPYASLLPLVFILCPCAGHSLNSPCRNHWNTQNPHLNTAPSTMFASGNYSHSQNIHQQNMQYVRMHTQVITLYLRS